MILFLSFEYDSISVGRALWLALGSMQYALFETMVSFWAGKCFTKSRSAPVSYLEWLDLRKVKSRLW